MKYAGSHVGKLPEFFVRNDLDRLGIPDDPGIHNEESGNVSPVFVEIRMDGKRHKRSADIGTSSRKRHDSPVFLSSVKSGDDSSLKI